MFAPPIRPRDETAYRAARRLRSLGYPFKRIAALLEVSPSTVHLWARDIELSPEQRRRNLVGPGGPANPEAVAARAAAWSETCRSRRLAYQLEGRQRARKRDPLHMAGCMLYWAEGTKHRNCLKLANSDPDLLRFFVRFLEESFGITTQDFTARVNCYTTTDQCLDAVEEHWSATLGIPRAAFSKATVNALPTSSSGRKQGKLPYGVCTVGVRRSTWLIQHIYGAIQEYAGFDNPAWLD